MKMTKYIHKNKTITVIFRSVSMNTAFSELYANIQKYNMHELNKLQVMTQNSAKYSQTCSG